MATEKTPNYTAAQEAVIREYVAKTGANKETAAVIASDARMNKEDGSPRNTRSIIAKMTRMDVDYVRQVPVSKSGGEIVKKTELVNRIATLAAVSAAKLDGLDKAPKLALETLVEALRA